MASPLISVVVPFYNVADHLGECLRSIAAQTVHDLEVIMVDDGSTDASAEVARAHALADPRFSLIQVPNGGPGYARNQGVAHAHGEYLAFVDGDDMLPPRAYETLMHTLARSGSDFACGNVDRIGPYGIRPSGLHARAIKGRQIGTHITRTPRLLYDISVFNKLFRKRFWDSAKLSFPEVRSWEDLQLMTRAHVLARTVDVIPDHIYYWRERGLGELSITQSRTDIGNLRDRIEALLVIDAFLAGHAPARLLRRHQDKALGNDLWLYVGDLYRVDDDYRAEFLDLVNSYLDQVKPRVLARLPATRKLAYHLIRQRDMAGLLALVAWQLDRPVRAVPLVRRHGRLLADLPLRDDPGRRIPARVFRPHWRELDPAVRVDELGWRHGKLVIAGRAYIPSIDIGKRRHSTKIVVLRPRQRRRPPIVVRARSFVHPDATDLSRQDGYCYDWAGFRCEISPRWFRPLGRWLTGQWEGYLLVRSRGAWRPARIHTPEPGSAERPEAREVAPGVRLRARWEGRNLIVELLRVRAVLAAHAMISDHNGRAGSLELDVDLPGLDQAAVTGPDGVPGAAEDASIVFTRGGGAPPLTFPASVVTAGPGVRLHGSVPLGRLLAAGGSGDEPGGAAVGAAAPGTVAGDGARWEVHASLAGRGRWRVAVPALPAAFTAPASALPRHRGEQPAPADFDRGAAAVGPGSAAGRRYAWGSSEIVVGWTRYGDLMVSARAPRPVIDEHTWAADGRLLLRGSYLGPAGSLGAIVLLRAASGERHRVSCRPSGERFAAEIDVGKMPSFGREMPLRDGRWEIKFEPGTADGPAAAAGLFAVGYDQAWLGDVTQKAIDVSRKSYQLAVIGDETPTIVVTTRRPWTERGRFNQRVLRRGYYPLKLRTPLRDAVVFVSWKGKHCSDNPLGIAAELRRRGDDREHIWVVTDLAVPAPPGATVVLAGSQEYYDALACSRYLVANDDMPRHFRKRDGQVYLQTWHGTPVKRIGFDIGRPQFASGAAYLDHLAEDVARWDLLLSQNPFSTPVLRRAFRFDGEICESGYPRNDVLRRPDAAALAQDVRRRLQIPGAKRVVLYAPTWRDNQFYAAGRYRFDPRLDLQAAWKALGDDYVILIRGHHHMADDVPDAALPGFTVNVTRYPDLAELFLVSDILVTDYSSVMFDYAGTGRPMLFFTYDLEDYRDNLRGFYFDLEEVAPGPLLATSDEVIAAIGDVDALAARYAPAYAAFAAKFCPLDDGKAGARACDRLLRQQ